MNDEEKKAIKNIKKEFEKNHILPDIANEDLGTLLNLIEKQSKEIEELNKSDESKEQSSMKYYNLYRELVDKIKAKIEEVEQWELYNMKIPRLSTLDERLGAKIGIKYVLQSLLEKE